LHLCPGRHRVCDGRRDCGVVRLIFLLLLLAADPGMVSIPAGEFTMGRTKFTPDDKTKMRPQILLDDRPAHKVYLDAYEIDAHEVTNSDYGLFVKATGHRKPHHWI